MNIPVITKAWRTRQSRKRAEAYAKHITDVRAMQHHLPTTPEVVPYPQNSNALRSMFFKVAMLRTSGDVINKHTWRDPPKMKPKFEAKCPRCLTEYQEFKEYCDNPECTILAIRTRKPDVSQKPRYQEMEKLMNANKKTFLKLCKQFTEEVHITDNPWLTVSYDYQLDTLTGEILDKKPVEFNFSKSEVMRLIQDNYGRPGGLYYTCVNHRDVLFEKDNRFEPCPHCNSPLHEVTAISVKYNQPSTQSIRESIDKPYIEGEWYHDPYYTETTGYGISPIYTLWVMASSIWYMDENLQNTYKLGRPPKSLLIFNSYNAKSIHDQTASEFTRAQNNRNYMPKIAWPWQGKTPAMALNLMPNDSEIQTIEHKKDIRERMSALYGVSPILQADTSIGGGLNNEGMQLTVTTLRLETIHQWLEDGLFRFMFNCFGISDWILKFPPQKEEDRMAVLQRRKENLQMIGEALNRGADYRITNEEDLEFEIVGHMGMLDQGGMGAGYKDMGGSGWDPRDWMKQDSSFAFSKSMKKAMSQKTLDAIKEFIEDIAYILRLPEHEPFLTLAVEGLKENLMEGMRDDFVEQLVEGMRAAGLDIANITVDSSELDRILESIQFEDSLQRLEDDVLGMMDDFNIESSGEAIMNQLMEIGAYVSNSIGEIQRTEANNMANLGREAAYSYQDPEDDVYDYDWVGPDYTEGRSTEVCEVIKGMFEAERKEVGRVSRARAREIVAEEGCKEHGEEKAFCLNRDWTPHYNCRHHLVARTFTRSMVPVPGGHVSLGKGIRHIKDPSEAPKGVNVLEGPQGRYYYETSEVEGTTEEEIEEEGEEKPVGEDNLEGGTDSGDVYQAIGVRDENGTWEIKFHNPDEKDTIESELQQSGYQFSGEYWVLMTEAEPVG